LPPSAFPASNIPLTSITSSSSSSFSSSSANEGPFPPSPVLLRDPLRAG
jgi:hypothetical protein